MKQPNKPKKPKPFKKGQLIRIINPEFYCHDKIAKIVNIVNMAGETLFMVYFATPYNRLPGVLKINEMRHLTKLEELIYG